MKSLNRLFTRIAVEHLNIPTLKYRKTDSLAFHNVSVWAVRSALKTAYVAGASAVEPTATKPRMAVVSVRHGLVEEVRANRPLHVLVEDWDGTEVRPSHQEIESEPMLPSEEAHLTDFFRATNDQEE
jgi:hypothetical protein